MKTIRLFFAFPAILLSSCGGSSDIPSTYENSPTPAQVLTYPIVEIETRLGTMNFWLFDETPNHKAKFIELANAQHYNAFTFNRVVSDFVIQGGESERLDTQRYKARYERYKISPEFKENRKHKYGAVALARDWKENPRKKSTAFEFYIVQL